MAYGPTQHPQPTRLYKPCALLEWNEIICTFHTNILAECLVYQLQTADKHDVGLLQILCCQLDGLIVGRHHVIQV